MYSAWSSGAYPGTVRADAVRNRQAILDAARTLFSRYGLDVSMETVAQTAGVGVGTVYRRFPDRQGLVQAVVADRIEHVGRLVDQATQGMASADPEAAWERFFGGLIDSGLPMLLPLLVPHVRDAAVFTEEMTRHRTEVIVRADGVLRAAQQHGIVRDDVGAPEVVLMLATALQMLPGLPDELNAALLARRAPLLRAALRPGGEPLPGAPVGIDRLLAVLTGP